MSGTISCFIKNQFEINPNYFSNVISRLSITTVFGFIHIFSERKNVAQLQGIHSKLPSQNTKTQLKTFTNITASTEPSFYSTELQHTWQQLCPPHQCSCCCLNQYASNLLALDHFILNCENRNITLFLAAEQTERYDQLFPQQMICIFSNS